MFDLIVLTQYPRTYAPKRFKAESVSHDFVSKIKSYKYTDLNNLSDAKFVILREPTAAKNIYELRDEILNHYLKLGSKVLNAESYLKWSVLDKITQHNEFKVAGIPHIAPLNLDDAIYPFIVKSKLGSHGDSVYKIENKEDLDRVLLKHNKTDLLVQEFQTSGFDLRVIVLGGRVLGIMKRTPKVGDFLSNYSQGGGIEKYTGMDTSLIGEIAIKAATHFKLEYVGVDLMKGNDGEWKVLEVNRACQFKGFEQATGVNIASEVINYFTNL